MTARELMEELFALSEAADFSRTCDTCKAGDPDKEIRRVAVAMLPTVEVIKAAADWGADFLLVHEPMYFNHMDEHSDDPVEVQKRTLAEQTDMTVWRYHDHPHATRPDIIDEGALRSLDLGGEKEILSDGRIRFHTEAPVTPAALAAVMEKKWNLRHIRICGAKDAPCHHISLALGASGADATFAEFKCPECEILVAGELREWSIGEYARDAAALGYQKAVLILGHEGSEKAGMVYTAEIVKEMHPELKVQYFESGETYA